MIGLGEVMATAFGLDVNRFVALAVLAGSVVVAAAVAFGGLVAFVGLAAPHIARWLVGPMHRPLLPASALVIAQDRSESSGSSRVPSSPAGMPNMAGSGAGMAASIAMSSWRGQYTEPPLSPGARSRHAGRGRRHPG